MREMVGREAFPDPTPSRPLHRLRISQLCAGVFEARSVRRTGVKSSGLARKEKKTVTPEERFTKIENAIRYLTEKQVHSDLQIEQNRAAIRDLIIVSRTLVDSQKSNQAQIQQMLDAQRGTDEKLHALIETVDRIIRDRWR
jgi:hypothetical protein